jgi:DnaJ-class molecular chaperone
VRNQKELFIRVSEAYTILSDPIKRSKYNTSIQLQIEEENRLQAITNILYPPKIIKVYDTFDDYYKSMQKHKDKYGKRNLKTMY